MNPFIDTITSPEEAIRNRSFRELAGRMNAGELLAFCDGLEHFRKQSGNLYHKVRAALFLYSAYRFHLSEAPDFTKSTAVPYEGFTDLLERRYEEAIARFLAVQAKEGPSGNLFSALAEAYHHLSFQTLADQVRKSVRASRGNQWMFRVGHAEDHPLRVRPELLNRTKDSPLYPVLTEETPVRLDLSHSGWSDIFFLGMDYPECARVLNISVDLAVYGRDTATRPPVSAHIRVLPEPVIRLTSIDLGATKDVSELRDLFNFGNDYLSLLKAGIIASGFVPPSFEGTDQPLAKILARVVGPGMGLELVTYVNDIPKGSRLAVSTNLLASIIAALMRATGQTAELEGGLSEEERRLAASRAILGEWLGGSGGGWQDSGGVWPGIKLIQGALAQEGDPEFGVSRGCLLPRHRLLDEEDLHPEVMDRLAQSLVLVHGGMAQNVGPILEMVTEKYLLRAQPEWDARNAMRSILDGILHSLKKGDVQTLAGWTTKNWDQPLKTIIPWVTNLFTESIIAHSRECLGKDFWGFLMLGGMSGGGMGLLAAPERHNAFRDEVLGIMGDTKRLLEDVLPFAMDPVVYDFKVNPRGTWAALRRGQDALLPNQYYALQIPEMVRQNAGELPYLRRAELDLFTTKCGEGASSYRMLQTLVGHLFRVSDSTQPERRAWDKTAANIRKSHGFDAIQHEQIRQDLRAGRIGLARNRMPVDTDVRDVRKGDVALLDETSDKAKAGGEKALKEGRVAVLSLAAGVGSRWTGGAGVIKALNPFAHLAGKHRSFLELHVAKTARVAAAFSAPPPHLISTSYLTHASVEKHLGLNENYGYDGPLYLSPGRAICQRVVPMVRDLVFLWEEMPQETLDEQKQKVREAVRGALMDWARALGEGADYVDNVPLQRFSPPGHWYEVPNLLRNGVLAKLLKEHPEVETIMLHNIDTLGADLDPAAVGQHLESKNVLTFEVVPRRIYDRGGGLARVNGKLRLLEGLAQPREEDELRLSYYNTMTTWIQIDPLLERFGLTRADLDGPEAHISAAVRDMGRRMPTYVTIKDVKRRWGHGQEDVYPVAQFEKLWGDMSALPDVPCGYLAVPRMRGQQLKDPDQLDAWANDGSKEHIERICGL